MSDEEIEARTRWFAWYVEQLGREPAAEKVQPGQLHRCPCCRCRTLEGRGAFLICPVCFWEDDGQDDRDADVVRGGPNGALSLTDARENYRLHGACEPRFRDKVRPPTQSELAE